MIRHVFFDLDNTLTLSRTVVAPEHRQAFEDLCNAKDVIVVSGARAEQIRTQIPYGSYYILAQHGNDATDPVGKSLWRDELSAPQIAEVLEFIEQLKKELGIAVNDEKDLVENRGAQIGYSLIGHHTPREQKAVFDPDSSRRIAILKSHPKEVAHLKKIGVDIEPGGSTSIDFFLAGKHKGYNVVKLITALSWVKDECVYVGDELAPGRNDESVIGVIPTHAVANPDETFSYISKELLS